MNHWWALFTFSSRSFALFNRFLCLFLLPLSGYGGLLDRHLNAQKHDNPPFRNQETKLI